MLISKNWSKYKKISSILRKIGEKKTSWKICCSRVLVVWIFSKVYVHEHQIMALQNLTVHVTSGSQQLLELAEEMDIRKRDKHGVLREFTMHELEDFINPADKSELLSSSEKQTLVRHELENIRALSHEICVLGYPEYPLYEGQSICK